MGFENLEQEGPKIKKNPQPVEKQDDFLDKNPEIKKIGEDLKLAYPKLDLDIFQQIAQKITEKISKEDFIKSGYNILSHFLNDNNFIIDPNDDDQIKQFIERIKNEKKSLNKDIIINDIKKDNQDKQTASKERIEQTKTKMAMLQGQYTTLIGNKPELKVDITSQEFISFKNEHLSQVQEKLTNAGISDIDAYLTHRFTALQLSKSRDAIPGKYEFIQNFNQLNRILDIDIQIPIEENAGARMVGPQAVSLHDFESPSGADKILLNNSVKDYVKSQERIIEKFDDIDDDIILKFYSEAIHKNIVENLQTNNLDAGYIAYFDPTTGRIDEKSTGYQALDEKTRTDLQQIAASVTTAFEQSGKKEMLDISNQIIKGRIMANCMRGLASYFDLTNDNLENFTSDFKLDGNKDIDFSNNILHLKGMINGSYVGFYYDLQTGSFQMDDLVYKTPEGTYKLGLNNGGRQNLPVRLPTIEELKDDAKNIDYHALSKTSDDLDTYKEKLKNDLDTALYVDFGRKELNQYYIHQVNEKNMALQENMNYMFNNRGIEMDWIHSKEFTPDIDPNQFALLKIIDDTLEYYKKSGTYLQFRDAFSKFNMLVNTKKIYDGTSSEPMINYVFNHKKMINSGKGRLSDGENARLNYLDFYTMTTIDKGINKIIDIDTIEKITGILEKDEKIEDHSFSSGFEEKYNAYMADKTLESNLKKIKQES